MRISPRFVIMKQLRILDDEAIIFIFIFFTVVRDSAMWYTQNLSKLQASKAQVFKAHSFFFCRSEIALKRSRRGGWL